MTFQKIENKTNEVKPASSGDITLKLNELDGQALDAIIKHLYEKTVKTCGYHEAPALSSPAELKDKIELINQLRSFVFDFSGSASLPETDKPVASAPLVRNKVALKPIKNDETNSFKTAVKPKKTSTKKAKLKLIGQQELAKNPLANRPIDEDEDEKSENEGNLFSLQNYYFDELKNPATAKFKAQYTIEIGVFQNGELAEIQHLTPGTSYKIKKGWKNVPIAQVTKDGRCLARVPHADIAGNVHLGSKIQKVEKTNYFTLQPNGWLHIKYQGITYFVRQVVPTQSAVINEPKPKTLKAWSKYLAGSSTVHLALVTAMAVFGATTLSKPAVDDEPEFIALDVSKLIEEPVKPKPVEIVKPKVQPKPVVKEQVAPKPKTPKPVLKKVVTPKPVTPKKIVKTIAKAPAKPVVQKKVEKTVQQTGLLAALPTKSTASTGSKSALALASNLDAVSASSKNSKISVSGLTAKVDGVQTSLSSGQMLNTKNGATALRAGSAGQAGSLEAGTASGGSVKGTVSATATKEAKVKGGISRAQVKKVIDAHMNEVTYCYETALAIDPGLGGKIVFEWNILLSGNVGKVGIKTSTVQSNSLHNCIQSQIKGWQFPKPTGSDVFVSYPFVFNMVGF